SRSRRSSMPPGYFGFTSPPVLSVRQYGVMRLAPAASASAAAWAAIQAKIPVVIGQAIVAPCFAARVLRISSMVMSFPLGTRLMSGSRGDDREERTRAYGQDLFARLDRRGPMVFSPAWLDDQLMQWSMSDPAVKVQMFRFIDALPNLRTSSEISQHLKEYL